MKHNQNGSNNPNWRGGINTASINRNCERCSKPFKTFLRETRRGKGRFCSASCANSALAARKKNPNWRAEWMARKKDDPQYKKQRAANSVIENEIKQGRLIRMPCEVCGETPSEGHHDDYDKPKEVRWLCRSHHMQFHRSKAVRPACSPKFQPSYP